MPDAAYAAGWAAGSKAGKRYAKNQYLRGLPHFGKLAYINGKKAGFREGFRKGKHAGYRLALAVMSRRPNWIPKYRSKK